jgi:ribonuclease BN (tRNA processing enzyme)
VSLSLTVLGCTAMYSAPGAPCSGYLVRSPQATVWMDCGSGTFAALQEHVAPSDVTALWISHLHPDHCADLLTAFNWAINTPDAPPLPVYGPGGWATRLAAMMPYEDGSRLVAEAFDVHEFHDGHAVVLGDLWLRSVAVEHAVPAFGLRAECNGRTLAYSGDTGPCDALVDLARSVDLFVCEAGAPEPQATHCTPHDAGHAAARAHAHRLMLTHFPVTADTAAAVTDAAQVAGCPVEAATPGMTVSLDG